MDSCHSGSEADRWVVPGNAGQEIGGEGRGRWGQDSSDVHQEDLDNEALAIAGGRRDRWDQGSWDVRQADLDTLGQGIEVEVPGQHILVASWGGLEESLAGLEDGWGREGNHSVG